MPFPSCPSPPPPMPSPVLVPVPLPSPPPFTKRPSRSRLVPPIAAPSPPPTKTLHTSSYDILHRAARSPRFSGDAPKPDSARPCPPSSPPVSSVRTPKRTHPSRCRSPPPSPAIRSPPPPVPPIPAFVLATNNSFFGPSHEPAVANRVPALDLYLDRPREELANMRCETRAGGALTCMQFLAVHNQTGQCGA